MVRAYQADRAVDRKSIEHFIDLAIHAPSAGFSQGWHFLVLDLPEAVQAFWRTAASEEAGNSWLDGMRSAPALILALSDKEAYLDRYAEPDKGWADKSEARWPVPYWDLDTAMASMLILLAVVDHGLAGCFFGLPAEQWSAVREEFGIPDRLRPIGVISIGYPAADRPSPSLRRGRRDGPLVTSYQRFGMS